MCIELLHAVLLHLEAEVDAAKEINGGLDVGVIFGIDADAGLAF
jgi:hypothetical protein